MNSLTCAHIDVRFGSFSALSDLSLTFQTGKVTALIGPNGAGKTTLMNVMSGLQKPNSGSVSLHGKDVTKTAAWQRVRMGMMRSFQIVSVVPGLTLFENIRIAVLRLRVSGLVFWRSVESYQEIDSEVETFMAEHGLSAIRDRPAGSLSHGEQRRLDLALSVIGDPSVLLLDEPLAGVGNVEHEEFVHSIKTVCEGRTVVLVEHNMDAVMKLADHIVCLAGGKVLVSGTPAEVREDPRVHAVYLGTHTEEAHAEVD